MKEKPLRVQRIDYFKAVQGANESFEDFSRENSDYLDTWVEERAFEFFNS